MTKAKGNMYKFVTHTHNAIKGVCPHHCEYCYMNKIYKKGWIEPKDIYLDRKALNNNLGNGKFYFIGSSTDMFAENIPRDWIIDALIQTYKHPENKYLFQTKNPRRYFDFTEYFSNKNQYLGITLETNRWYHSMGYAPVPKIRVDHFANFFAMNRFLTIEPIMDFDDFIFIPAIKEINPHFVNIGADSGKNNLPEPEPEKIIELISELKKFTKVQLKKNIKRIIGETLYESINS